MTSDKYTIVKIGTKQLNNSNTDYTYKFASTIDKTRDYSQIIVLFIYSSMIYIYLYIKKYFNAFLRRQNQNLTLFNFVKLILYKIFWLLFFNLVVLSNILNYTKMRKHVKVNNNNAI